MLCRLLFLAEVYRLQLFFVSFLKFVCIETIQVKYMTLYNILVYLLHASLTGLLLTLGALRWHHLVQSMSHHSVVYTYVVCMITVVAEHAHVWPPGHRHTWGTYHTLMIYKCCNLYSVHVV